MNPPPTTGPLPADGAAGSQPSDPLVCQFCEEPAIAACPRCSTLFCPQHGGNLCDACTDPRGGLPSRTVLRAMTLLLAVTLPLAVWFLIAPPRLPGETAPPPGTEPTPPARPSPRATVAGAPLTPATPAPQPTAAPTPVRYTIRPGDTLAGIAAQQGIALEALLAANPGVSATSLQIGQTITIPAP